jgi:hypothetical protein
VFVEFVDCYYLIRYNNFDEKSLSNLQIAIDAFFRDVKIFQTLGACKHFRLPSQHALRHYVSLIEDFGSPSGHDTAITENRHISAVKRPWRRSNPYKAILQMLRTNQRLDKLAALRTRLEEVGELQRKHAQAPQPGFSHGEEGGVDDEPPRDNENGYGQAILAKTPHT